MIFSPAVLDLFVSSIRRCDFTSFRTGEFGVCPPRVTAVMRGPPLSTRGMSGTVSVPDTTRLYPAASHAAMSGAIENSVGAHPGKGRAIFVARVPRVISPWACL